MSRSPSIKAAACGVASAVLIMMATRLSQNPSILTGLLLIATASMNRMIAA